LLGCNDQGNNAPRIAFVDITMSRSFPYKGKRAEVLLLEHDAGIGKERYYNKISRLETNNRAIILMWSAPPMAGGSLRRKSRKIRKRKRKNKSRRS
jgi:hypothetical protein